MVYPPNILTQNPPEALAKAFGFDRNYAPVNVKSVKHIEDNTEHKCLMCGRVQKSGYIDKKRVLIGVNTNDFYSYIAPNSSFLCDYCYYCYKHYKKSMQSDLDRVYGDMGNIVVYADRIEEKHFNADEKNELYDLLRSPPKEAFAILLKRIKGNTFEANFHRFLPTIDSDLFVINYGAKEFFVPRKKVFACLDDFDRIAKELQAKKIDFSEDVFFNRSLSESYNYWFSPRLRNNKEFFALYMDFINEYDRGVRFTAKTIKRRWEKERRKDA